MVDLKPIEDAVGELDEVTTSVVKLLDELSAKVEQAKNDPAKVQEVVDSIRVRKQLLAESVTKNTPAA